MLFFLLLAKNCWEWIEMEVPSLKLTASLHLKMDGWKTTVLSFWDSAYFQGRAVCFRGCHNSSIRMETVLRFPFSFCLEM